MLCGVVRGALEMVNMRVECDYLRCTLWGDDALEIRVRLYVFYFFLFSFPPFFFGNVDMRVGCAYLRCTIS